MFDTIAETVRTETATNGRKGITPTELWEIVGKTVSNLAASINEKYADNPPLIDDAYKRCFWPIVIKDKRLEFYEDLNSIVEESQVPEIITDAQQPSSTSPDLATQPEKVTVIEESEAPQPVKRKAPVKAKGKGPVKKAKKPARKPAKKPKKKKKQKIAKDDDDDYSSDGYSPPSDDDESSEDEDEFDEDASDDQQEEANEESEEEKAPPPPKKTVTAEDILESNAKMNYRRIENITELSYDQVQTTYGARLRIVAEEKMRTEQLYVDVPPAGRSISANLQIVLEIILQHGPHGITQASLTKLLDLDPRSSGHYVKTLEQKGAITRKPVSHSGFRTNICIHIRYSKQGILDSGIQDYQAYNINASGVAFTPKRLRMRMAALLIDAKDHVMYTDDILNALGFNSRNKLVKKWYHRCLDELCNKNIFRKAIGSERKAGTSRCVQLVDPNQAIIDLGSSSKTSWSRYQIQMNDEMRFKGGAGLVLNLSNGHRQPPAGQYYDTTLENQIVDVLAAAGTKGATQKEIMFLLSFGEQKAMHKILESMEGIKHTPEALKYLCCRDFEFEGRIRRYRYYSYAAYRKLKDGIDIEVTGPPLLEVPKSKLKEFDFRIPESIPSAQPRRRATTAKPPGETRTKAVRQHDEPSTAASSEEAASQPSNNKSVKVASIFQRQQRVNKNSESDTTGQKSAEAAAESTTSAPVTRKRTRRTSVATETATQETAVPPVKKKRGHPKKQPVNTDSASSQPSTSSQPSAPSELPVTTEALTSSEPSAPTEPPVTRRSGRRQSLKTAPSSLQPSGSSEAETPAESSASTETPTPIKAPAKRKSNSRSKKSSNVTSKSSQPQNDALEAATPSTQTAAPSPRRGNLFDYFTSRNSPGPSSPRQPQTTQETFSEPLPFTPRSPGTLHRQLVEARDDNSSQQSVERASQQSVDATPQQSVDTASQQSVDTAPQQNADTASQPPEEASPNAAGTKVAFATKGKRVVRKRFENAFGENIVRTKLGIVSARHVRAGNNAYKEFRQKTILAMLEDNPIYERSYEMKDIFVTKMKELYPNETLSSGLCLKTLWRTAKELEELGQIRTAEHTFTNLNGNKGKKLFLMRKELDPDGVEVHDYIAHMKDKHSLRPNRPLKLVKLEKLDSEVERLEGRLERMENEYNALEDKQGMDALHLTEEIKELRSNMAKATTLEREILDEPIRATGNWLMIATQFGYVNARMIRVKLLHQHIFGLLGQGVDGVDRETSTIKTTAILSYMTLRRYCEVIAIAEPQEELLEYTRDQEKMDTLICELPLSVRKSVFASSKKFRGYMRMYLDLMQTLGLVKACRPRSTEPRTSESPPIMADYYQVCSDVTMIDYRSEDRRVLHNYTLNTASDLMIYWSELQFTYANSENVTELPNFDDCEPEIRALAKSLTTVKNWTTSHIITRELRDHLNAYVNTEANQTPYKNYRQCRQIASELKVSENLVIGYFRKLESALARKERSNRRVLINRLESDIRERRRPRRRRGVQGPDSTSMAMNRVFQKTTRGSTKLRLLKANQYTEESGNAELDAENPFLDPEHQIPVVTDNSQVENFRLRRILRQPWASNEDELLIYCYVIMKHHSSVYDCRFLWSHAKPLFPGRTPASCRSRLDKLRAVPALSEYIYTLVADWPEMHDQGLEEGAFKAPDPDGGEYDLLARLTYFIQRLQTEQSERSDSKNLLPSSMAVLHDKYTVTRVLPISKKQKFTLEDRFHLHAVSFKSKNEALLSGYLSLRGSHTCLDNSVSVDESNPIVRGSELLQVFFKMTLFTPMEVYDPFFAYAVINSQPSESINDAINTMRKSGVLTKSRGDRIMDRRLPGIFYSISKKYLNDMACSLPDKFLSQAREYKRFLGVHKKTMFMPILVSSGMMGCMLDMISQHQLVLTMHDEERTRRRHQEPTSKIRQIDTSRMEFDLELETVDTEPEETNIQDKNLSTIMSPRSSKVLPLTLEKLQVEWSGYYSSQSPSLRPLLKIIMDLLQEVKEDGATLIDIKDKILETLPDIKDHEIRNGVNLLRNSQPPLIHLVGFESLRYVTTAHLGNWVVKTKGITTLHPHTPEFADIARALVDKRAQVIDPRVWIDVNGGVCIPILEECLHIVFQRVMERPGILEREVQRLFQDLLTYAELKDLLDILTMRGAIRKVTVLFTGPLKRNLFSKPRKYTKVDPDVIDCTAQTSYFSQPGYYQQLSLPKSSEVVSQ